MNISVLDISVPSALRVRVSFDTLEVELSDSRMITVPVAWFPRLAHATDAERGNWRLIGRRLGIHWEYLDEDIRIESLIVGRPSAETQTSLATWLSNRKAKNA